MNRDNRDDRDSRLGKTAAATAGANPEAEVVYDPVKSRDRFTKWFPALAATDIDKLIIYLDQLNKFNKAVNLVSPATLRNADAVHLADAVHASQMIVSKLVAGAPLYDLGSGNGFPGLVIGILNPGLKVVLVDRDERKLEFCKHVATETKSANISVMKSDIEALKDGSLVNVVARGLAPLSKALLLTRGSIAKGGKFFHLKGDNWATELAQVPSQLFTYWQPSLLGMYRLPDQGAEMSVVLTEKMA